MQLVHVHHVQDRLHQRRKLYERSLLELHQRLRLYGLTPIKEARDGSVENGVEERRGEARRLGGVLMRA